MCDSQADGGRRCPSSAAHCAQKVVIRSEARTEALNRKLEHLFDDRPVSEVMFPEKPVSEVMFPSRRRARFRALVAQLLAACDRRWEARRQSIQASQRKDGDTFRAARLQKLSLKVYAADLHLTAEQSAAQLDRDNPYYDRKTELKFQLDALDDERRRAIRVVEELPALKDRDKKPLKKSCLPTTLKERHNKSEARVRALTEQESALKKAWKKMPSTRERESSISDAKYGLYLAECRLAEAQAEAQATEMETAS
jgi:hypothetical protein